MENAPVREIESLREMNKMSSNINLLEKVAEEFSVRLDKYTRPSTPEENKTSNPENYSKFAQELGGLNYRLENLGDRMTDLLKRLEI